MSGASLITLITLPTCSPGWGTHILFVGILRLQESLKFENYDTDWNKTKDGEIKRLERIRNK